MTGVLANVQVLRALAVLIVVYSHITAVVYHDSASGIGKGGVAIFFVISGFIMVYTTRGKTISPAVFMINRISRIVPLYWLTTFAVFALALIAPRLLQSTTADLGDLIKSLFFIPFRKTNGEIHPDLPQGWSLNYEMFFYALFAIGLFFRPYNRGIIIITSVLAAFVCAGIYYKPSSIIFAFYSAPYLLDFSAGMLIALFMDHLPLEAGFREKFAVAAVAISALATLIALPSITSGTTHLYASGILGTIIVASMVALEKWDTRINNPFLLSLGNASYSIYLTHLFMIWGIMVFAKKVSGSPFLTALCAAVVWIVTLGLGIAIYEKIERPLCAKMRNLLMQFYGRVKPAPQSY